MHEPRRTNHFASVGDRHRLMAQTDPKNRELPAEPTNGLNGNSGFFWSAGPR